MLICNSIFANISTIKGAKLKIGDKVNYDCTYSKNLPFNWNANMVQLASTPLGFTSGLGPGAHGGQPYEPKPPERPPVPSQQQYSMHQQPPQQSSNYSVSHTQYQPTPNPSSSSTSNNNSNYYQPQQKAMPYQSQQYQPPYGSSSNHSSNQVPPPHQPSQAPSHQTTTQVPPARPVPAPFPDIAKVQQAVAAAAQLAQFYPPSQGSGSNVSVPSSMGNAHPSTLQPPPSSQSAKQPGGGPPQQPSGPPSTPFGSIQYTSTPGIF